MSTPAAGWPPCGAAGATRANASRRCRRSSCGKLEQAGLTPAGAPLFAGYDAPSTLPFLRRLEIWVPIA